MINIINFLKAHYKTILAVLFGLYVLYYLIFFLTPSVRMLKTDKAQINSLNVTIEQLHQDNLKLEEKIDNYDQKIDDVNNSIDKIKGQKTLVKEIYHEKINSVDKLTIRELDSFFTDRYKY